LGKLDWCGSLDVRFAPDSDQILRRSENAAMGQQQTHALQYDKKENPVSNKLGAGSYGRLT